MFLGTYEPKLDDKGRMFLPARFREDMEGGIVLTLQELKSPEVIEEHRLQGCGGIESQSLCEESLGGSVISAVASCEAGVDEAGIAGAIDGRCRLLLGGGVERCKEEAHEEGYEGKGNYLSGASHRMEWGRG